MKIRDLILALLVIGMVISTGILVGFASSGISDIKDTTSEASSGELLGIASRNLEDIAISIRDSLDSQMQNQYEMVKTWANEPTILEAARKAQTYSVEELYEMWSAEATRVYNDKDEATGDANPDNDLSPDVSEYLTRLAIMTKYLEISITDSRGYTIAANGATGDFDQGPDDWRLILQAGNPVFMKFGSDPGGEDWYKGANQATDGFYVSDIIWNDSTESWGVEIVSQLRDPVTYGYLGQIKAVFDYGKFIDQFVKAENYNVYEIKMVDNIGIIVATSLENKNKINNALFNMQDQAIFKDVIAKGIGSTSQSYIDENDEDVFVGYARSNDTNGHIIMVSKKVSDIAEPIDKFIGTLQDNISEKSSVLQRNMIIIGAAVAIVIIVLAALIIRAKVAIPLKKLTTVSDKLTKGEIEGLEIDLKGKDEISKFGESFKGVLAAFNFLKEEAEKKQ